MRFVPVLSVLLAGTACSGGNDGSVPQGSAGKSSGQGSGGSNGTGGGANLPPTDCSKLTPPGAKFTTLEGFTAAEDFAFDESGNYVGVDEDLNLVRISKQGKKQLWAPGMPAVTAGTAALPDGSVVIADATAGALLRVYPNGGREVMIAGLLYPNGIDIGPDGFVYVAENFAGRVRRVDPETGNYSIVALGLRGPNGVAIGNDDSLLYVGSFEGSGVYEVKLGKPGELGEARVLARPHGSMLDEPMLLCPDQVVGPKCTTTVASSGTCQQLANVIDCVEDNKCMGAPDGKACTQYGLPGQCKGGTCAPSDACAGAKDGAACEGGGVCGDGFCIPPDPCTNKVVGDSCSYDDAAAGVCADEQGFTYCRLPGSCDDKKENDACRHEVDGSAGQCRSGSCVPPTCGSDCLVACTKNDIGKTCYGGFGSLGKCAEEQGYLGCLPSTDGQPGGAKPGGIDGIALDACGNIYATEFEHGILWRISPKGEIERLADLPSSWIPNLKWGRGLGGFERDTLYVADRDDNRLFEIPTGTTGAREFYDQGKP